jgi:hypothetical protein
MHLEQGRVVFISHTSLQYALQLEKNRLRININLRGHLGGRN